MPEKPTASVSAAFQSLPENIRDWATSDSTMFSISEINTRLGLKEEKKRVIPSLVLRLITQNLDPQDFINELSYELGTSFQTAKSISQDIENSILKPVENELRKDVGVDVKLIYFGQPAARRPETKFPIPNSQFLSSETQKPALPVPPTPQPVPPAATPIQKEQPTIDLKSFEFKGEAPFILHKEGQTYPTVASSEFPKTKPSLNIKVQNYYQSEQETKKPAPKPTVIKLETPPSVGVKSQQEKNIAQPTEIKARVQNLAANIEEQKSRVVHYSGPTTKLNNLGLPKIPNQNTIDLRKLK